MANPTDLLARQAERKQQEPELMGKAVARLALEQINVIDVSCGTDGENDIVWGVVEFSNSTGKWTKFCVQNNSLYSSDFIEYIIDVVRRARQELRIK